MLEGPVASSAVVREVKDDDHIQRTREGKVT